ncbi:PadR family transcriptional regulator [Puniceibacterium antarcticum]|uniref:PadR family transcriptional regulator n=1 Tax=Puniceibacterium antarcticum TaxID=1206336 RepID=UPI003CCBA4F5
MASRPEEECSGYEICKLLGFSSGTVYPLLVKADKLGLLSSRWENAEPSDLGRPRRKYYRITGQGLHAVEGRMRQLRLELRPLRGCQDGVAFG